MNSENVFLRESEQSYNRITMGIDYNGHVIIKSFILVFPSCYVLDDGEEVMYRRTVRAA